MIVTAKVKMGTVPPLWDGHAGERIADVLQRLYAVRKGDEVRYSFREKTAEVPAVWHDRCA